MAKANVMIDNQKTRVTEWSFEVGDSTGQHIHEYDYVVVPLLDGELKIVNHDGEETISKLAKGGSYFREKGVNHNVFNNNDFIYKFIEIEFKQMEKKFSVSYKKSDLDQFDKIITNKQTDKKVK